MGNAVRARCCRRHARGLFGLNTCWQMVQPCPRCMLFHVGWAVHDCEMPIHFGCHELHYDVHSLIHSRWQVTHACMKSSRCKLKMHPDVFWVRQKGFSQWVTGCNCHVCLRKIHAQMTDGEVSRDHSCQQTSSCARLADKMSIMMIEEGAVHMVNPQFPQREGISH